jgi:hypothetical protein
VPQKLEHFERAWDQDSRAKWRALKVQAPRRSLRFQAGDACCVDRWLLPPPPGGHRVLRLARMSDSLILDGAQVLIVDEIRCVGCITPDQCSHEGL